MSTTAWVWALLVTTVSSKPTTLALISPGGNTLHTRPSSPASEDVTYGESQGSRTIYTVVSMACLSLLTGLLGYRARQFGRQPFKTLNLTRILVLILYFLAISFVTSAAVVESGLGLATPSICHSAIAICLVFYLGSKITMYVFLVERAHAIRAPYMRRRSDWIWLSGMTLIGAGFGSIAICGFVWPISDLSGRDGRCRIGLPIKVTVPLLSFDVTINIALTAVFIYLLKPLLRFHNMPDAEDPTNLLTKGLRRIWKSTEQRRSVEVYPMNQNLHKAIEALLWKTLIGSVLVMLPTVGNMAALYSLRGRELGWLCLTVCTFDVTWAVCVIHGLTVGASEIHERDLAMLVHDSASAASGASGVSTMAMG